MRPIVDFVASYDAAAYKAQERSVQQCRTDMLLLRCALCVHRPGLQRRRSDVLLVRCAADRDVSGS